MNGERKYLGMTGMQIGILAGMVGILCLIVCAGGGFVATNMMNSGPSLAQFTPTVAPTVTPVVVASPTAVTTPTLAPIPYEQLIPEGWKQFKTALIEIWLPSNFKETNEKDLGVQGGVDMVELAAKEAVSKTSLYNMVVLVAYDPITAPTLDEYLKKELEALQAEDGARTTEYRTVNVNGREARRIVLETRVNSVDVNALIYVFQDGTTAWYVEYVAQINEFFDNLPMFEKSVKTFRPAQ
jgi:hypothetical protein